MARRSSARLRNQSATTPQRVSLSHDAPTRTPRTVPAKLSALAEDDEMPGAFPPSASPATTTVAYPSLPKSLARSAARETPTKGAPIKPDAQEMHPQLYHQSTVKARDEARHLGFSNMAPHTEPPKQKTRLGTLQDTPTRSRDLEKDARSPSYQFTFRREFSLELSPEAKKLMAEKREEAARIREQMVADGDVPQTIEETLTARRLAKPKGRFSQAHLLEQQKMDSIANHASAWRADPSRSKPVIEGKQADVKSLKRSPSKAKLDEPDTPSRPNSKEGTKPTPSFKGSALPRSTSFKDLKQAVAHSSPAKRVKCMGTDDVSANRPGSSDGGEKSTPATPNKQTKIATLSTPTQASLARAADAKSTNAGCKIPALQSTPGKVPLKSAMKKTAYFEEPKTSTPLLARSPAKATLFATTSTVNAPVEQPASMLSSSFARTPAKSGLFRKHVEAAEDNAADPNEEPVPFLSRSPLKASIVNTHEQDPSQAATPAVPFLSRSPRKLPMASASNVNETPDKSATSKLIGHFNLLRQSPMKSILRSPQRLYSDDPSKVAAGTHLATPPGKKAAVRNKALPITAPSTMQGRKHVDFSSSTKARDTKMEDAAISSDAKTPTPSPKADRTSNVVAEAGPQAQLNIAYPQLPIAVPTHDRMPSLSPSPQKRRQSAGPQDFTFRAGDHDIVFAQSPNAPASSARQARPATIRYVSADAVTPVASPKSTKKRKFDFENQKATSATDANVSPPIGTKKRKFNFENKLPAAKSSTDVATASDKENTPVMEDNDDEAEHRPAKRSKSSAPSPKQSVKTSSTVPKAATQMTAAAAARRTTLGVKPKGVKSSSPVKKPAARPSSTSTISQARLAALSQPKKRN